MLWLGAPEQPSLWGAGALGRWEFRKGCGPPLRRDLPFLEAENGCFVYRFFFQPHMKRELLGWVRFRDAWHLGFFTGFVHFGWLWLGAGAPRESQKPSVSYGAEKKNCTPLGVQNSSVFVLAIRGPWPRGEDRWVSWGCSAPLRGGGGPEGASPGPERSHEAGSRAGWTFLGEIVTVLPKKTRSLRKLHRFLIF